MANQDYQVIIADPAKNITAFVLDESANRQDYIPLSRSLMAREDLHIEQVGFLKPATMPGAVARLEMMGGEFCGNAGRSFGYFQAQAAGLRGKGTLTIEVSGSSAPLEVRVDMEAHTAEISMPLPTGVVLLELEGLASVPVVVFEGIAHAIVKGPKDEDLVARINAAADVQLGKPDAVGVMFLDERCEALIPAVYVRETDSLVYESSCGSGTVATAVYLTQGLPAGMYSYEIAQPGGTLAVRLEWDGQRVATAHMGGLVELGEPFSYAWVPDEALV